MRIIKFFNMLAAVLISGVSLNSHAAGGYPRVQVTNKTSMTMAFVSVKYAACSSDVVTSLAPGQTWTAKSDRGVCLITDIAAMGLPGVSKPYSAVVPYSSSGTSFSKFTITEFQGSYRVMSETEISGNGAGYPVVRIENKTIFPVKGKIEYSSPSCKDDEFEMAGAAPDPKKKDILVPTSWRATSRGICLVTAITAACTGNCKENGNVTRLNANTRIAQYQSIGTSYSNFSIQASDIGYRVYSAEEYKAETMQQSSTKSPGFRIINKTNWPVMIGIEQLGCLYHGIVKPEKDGGVPFIRDTGAVWFTLTAKTVDWDALELSDWDCVTPVVELVADVALWTASGGAAGVAINGLKMAAKEGSKAALKAGLKAITKESAKKAGKYVAFGTLAGLHQEVYTSVKADFENTGKIRESSLGGQYAGYAWPFRCDAMPTYEVRGGPNREDPTFTEGSELKIVKIDDCGIKMMN